MTSPIKPPPPWLVAQVERERREKNEQAINEWLKQLREAALQKQA